MKTIYQYFKDLRTKEKINQQEIADTLGIDRVSYSQFELGNRKLTVEEFQKLCWIREQDENILLNNISTDGNNK